MFFGGMSGLDGQKLGAYRLIESIGAGGMATVYRAHQISLGRDVAVKVLAPQLALDQDFLARFEREAKTAAQLDHPHIVSVYDYGVQGTTPYVVMQLLTGGSVAERLRVLKPPSLTETAVMIDQIAKALDYAHQLSLVHRDVKPGNILIDQLGNSYLADFGIAKLISASQTAATGAIGTANYIAPEQALGRPVDNRTDIYSLGVVAFNVITGRLPFQGETAAVIYQHVHQPPPSPRSFNARIPESVSDVCLKAMKKSPDERYQTTTEFSRAFEKAVQESREEAPEDEEEDTGFFTLTLPSSTASSPEDVKKKSVTPHHVNDVSPPVVEQKPKADTMFSIPKEQDLVLPDVDKETSRPRRTGLIALAATAFIVIAVVLVAALGSSSAQNAQSTQSAETEIALALTETAAVTPTSSPSPTPTPSPTATSTLTATPTATSTATPTPTATATSSTTSTSTSTATPTPTATNTPLPTSTSGAIIQSTITATPSETLSAIPTLTPSDTPTLTTTPTPSEMPSVTPTATATPTPSDTPAPSDTFTLAPTETPSATPTAAATLTPSDTPTLTTTPTPSETPTPTYNMPTAVYIWRYDVGFAERFDCALFGEIYTFLEAQLEQPTPESSETPTPIFEMGRPLIEDPDSAVNLIFDYCQEHPDDEAIPDDLFEEMQIELGALQRDLEQLLETPTPTP